MVFQVGPHWVEKWCPATRSGTKNDTPVNSSRRRDIGESAQHSLIEDVELESLAMLRSSSMPADLWTSHVARRSLTWHGCPFFSGAPCVGRSPRPETLSCQVSCFPDPRPNPLSWGPGTSKNPSCPQTTLSFCTGGQWENGEQVVFSLTRSFRNFFLPSPPPALVFTFELY